MNTWRPDTHKAKSAAPSHDRVSTDAAQPATDAPYEVPLYNLQHAPGPLFDAGRGF
jgi:hypothetical protein